MTLLAAYKVPWTRVASGDVVLSCDYLKALFSAWCFGLLKYSFVLLKCLLVGGTVKFELENTKPALQLLSE